MRAAFVSTYGQPPRLEEYAEPVAGADEVVVKVKAAGLSQLVRAIVAGKHYSSPKEPGFIAGTDGVGTLEDGTPVYFAFPRAPFGTMAEKTVVLRSHVAALPAGLDMVNAAAAANPGSSSWAALTRRAKFVKGESVLINGATGVSGRLAIQIAKHLGAKTVVATGRNERSIAPLKELGADVTLPLEGEPEVVRKRFFEAMSAAGVSVVLDYLYGDPARRILEAIAMRNHHEEQPRIRFVQIGNLAGAEIPLPASLLRSTGVELMGSGIGSVEMVDLIRATGEFLAATVSSGMRVETEPVPLADVEQAWNRESGDGRVVFTV
ncbi:MAG TPA: zinc-binding alcohol dehydrogenase family protein [Edaphobacter sp.]